MVAVRGEEALRREMAMQLLRDQVLIRPDEPIDKTSPDEMFKMQNGIFMPNVRQSQWATGTIVALGQYGRLNTDGSEHATTLAVGDRVLYRRHQVEEFDTALHEGTVLTSENAVVAVGIAEPAAKVCGESNGRDTCQHDQGHEGQHSFERASELAVVGADAED